MTSRGVFPFGEPVRDVSQTDRTPKKVFVLGVYASAIHARWVGADGKTTVNALAVASEPYIFWRGENPEVSIQRIQVPPALGKLMPASSQYNGPSGIALDELILKPLGIARADAWLCDLVPRSCVNPSQIKAIERAYLPVAEKHRLPKPSVSPVPAVLADAARREAIWNELQESGARTLILLGDKPIQWFLAHFDSRWRRLADFTHNGKPYGTPHEICLNGRPINVLPLAHPRQIARLGQSSADWHERHRLWVRNGARSVL